VVRQYWDAYEPRSVFTGGFAGMGFGTYGVLASSWRDRPPAVAPERRQLMMFPGAVATAVEHDIRSSG